MITKDLQCKNIFIYPFNEPALKLKSYFRKKLLKYNFMGFVDKSKVLSIDLGYKVYNPSILKSSNFDFIFINSPNYYKEILNELLNLNVPKSKIIDGLKFLSNEDGKTISPNFLDIKQFKNKHKGNRCFIIGTGPSLKTDDLDKLKNEITFGANGLFLGLNKTNFRPTYYSICDIKAMEYFETKINNFFTSSTTLLFPSFVLKATYPLKNAFYYKSKSSNKTTFDLYDGIYTGTTVIYNLISIAIYMGIKEINLIGLDFNYDFMDDIQSNHFIKDYPEDKNKKSALIEIQTWIRDFNNLKDILTDTGINIYNATRGGKLEVFQRVNFDNIIKDDKC
jgi:hypothetical protein